MRTALRQILLNGIPEIKEVYEPHAAGPEAEKPYLVIQEGVQDPESDWSAFSTVIEVWPFVRRTSFQQVDSLSNAVIDLLHRARFSHNGEEYLVDYIGSAGADGVVEEWEAITRGLRFRVFSLGWLKGVTYEPDPVATVQSWTKETWPQVHTDPTMWSPVDSAPGVYWRMVRCSLAEQTAAVNWMEAQLNGHVLAPSAATRLDWLRRVTEGLAKQRRLKMSDGGMMEFLRVAADSEADPMRRGQIQLTVRFGVLQPVAVYEVLCEAFVSGDIEEVLRR